MKSIRVVVYNKEEIMVMNIIQQRLTITGKIPKRVQDYILSFKNNNEVGPIVIQFVE